MDGSIPEGLHVATTLRGVIVTRRWWSWAIAVLIPFAIFWNGFLVFWYAMAFRPGTPLLMKLFPLIHVAVGVGIVYFIIASWFNRTEIRIESDALSVAHGPVPWPGSCRVEARGVAGVLVREVRGNKGRITHSLVLIGPDRREKTLLRSLAKREEAEFLGQLIRVRYNLAA